MKSDSDEGPSQELRNQLSAAIEANEIAAVEKLLLGEPSLANADLRELKKRNVFSYGHPLHRACRKNSQELAELLLNHGSNADSPGPDPEDRPVHGTPLHFAAAEHQNYRLANLLLDHGATPNSYPNCDKWTIERMFYHAREAGMPESIVRLAFAAYLPHRVGSEPQTVTDLAGPDSADAVKLFARMIDLGANPPFTALVREGFDDLLLEMIEHDESVADDFAGAARWYGYPKLVRRLMDHPSYRYSYKDVISTIGTAIGSHNRDGGYPEYREIILLQLEALEANGDLEKAQQDPGFKPLYHIASDFTWDNNYGYRAEIAEPECYIDLAELMVSWGFNDIEHRQVKTGHSPLSKAVERGRNPRIATYIQWLLDNGADLRESDPEAVSPLAIARAKGFSEIQQILEKHSD